MAENLTRSNSIIEAIHGTLKKNEIIEIAELGTFGALKRTARKGINPQTGKKITIPAMKVASFHSSQGTQDDRASVKVMADGGAG